MNQQNGYDENNKITENEAVKLPENEPALEAPAEKPPEKQAPPPPVNEYWVGHQNGTTPHGYGQGYMPYQPGGYPQAAATGSSSRPGSGPTITRAGSSTSTTQTADGNSLIRTAASGVFRITTKPPSIIMRKSRRKNEAGVLSFS